MVKLNKFYLLIGVAILTSGCQKTLENPFSPEFLATLTARAPIVTPLTATAPATILPSPQLTKLVTPEPPFQPSTPLPQYTGDIPGHIVFACYINSNDDICIMNPDGSGYTQLTNNPATDFYPSLTPDGQYIIFSSRRDDRFEVYRMQLDGSDQTRLTTGVGGAYAPVANLSGDVIFANDIGPYQSIWRVPLSGGKATSYIDLRTDTIDPTWSADGEIITFASSLSGERQVYWMDPDSTSPTMVTNRSDMGGRHSLSPDGSTFVFYAGTNYDRNIYTVNKNGSNLSKLTNGGDNLGPCWSPDGEWITFASWRDGNGEIYIMRADGSDVRRLTYNSYSDWQPRWGP